MILILAFFVFLTGCSTGQPGNQTGNPAESINEDKQGQASEKKEGQNPGPDQESATARGSQSIQILGIKEGDNLTSPVTIQGEGASEDNELMVELRNANREALVTEPVTIRSGSMGERGEFEITLRFQFNNTEEGFVAVYDKGQSQNEMNLVEIPVRYNQDKETTKK